MRGCQGVGGREENGDEEVVVISCTVLENNAQNFDGDK